MSPRETTAGGGSGRLYALIPLVIFIGLVGFFSRTLLSGRDPAALPSVMINRPAPDFQAPPLLDSKSGVARADLGGGKPAIVNFFASWCAPCREEHGTWAGYQASGGVPVYGIVYKDKPENAQKFLSDLGNPYDRIGQDISGRIAIDFGVYGVPETYIVDAAGNIRYRYAGAVTPSVLAGEILPRLAALDHEK